MNHFISQFSLAQVQNACTHRCRCHTVATFQLVSTATLGKTNKKQFVYHFNHISIFTSGTSKHHSLWWEISAGGAVRLCWWWWRRRGGPSRLSTTASILSLRRIPSMLIRWEQTLIILHDPQWFPMITNDPKWPEKVSITHAFDA